MWKSATVLFALAAAAQGVVYNWNSNAPAPRYWTTNTSWTPVGVPGAGDTAILSNVRTVEWNYGSDIKCDNITLLNGAELKFAVISGQATAQFGSITLQGGSKIFTNALAGATGKFAILNSLTVSSSVFSLNGQSTADLSGATLDAVNASITFSSGGYIRGFKAVNFNNASTFTCTEVPQGFTWSGSLTGSISNCAIYNSKVSALGPLTLQSAVLNNTQINANGYKVTVLPPSDSTLQETHLTDGSELYADELIFSYPYNLTNPSRDTYINCDAACKATVSVANFTLDGAVNNGYNVKIEVCLVVSGSIRVSNALYSNMSESAPAPYVHLAQGAVVNNVIPLTPVDGRRYTILIGGVYQKIVGLCPKKGSFTVSGVRGNLDLGIQEDATLDNVLLNGTLTISNTIDKKPANVLFKDSAAAGDIGVRNLKIGHGTLTLDQSVTAFNIQQGVTFEHPADYQMKQSVQSVGRITGKAVNVFPSTGITLNSPLSLRNANLSQMSVVVDVPLVSPGGDPVIIYVTNSPMKVDLSFTAPLPANPPFVKFMFVPQKIKSQNSTVDINFSINDNVVVDASPLNLNATTDGFSASSVFSVTIGNNATFVTPEWRMPSLTFSGNVHITGAKQIVWAADSVVANAAGNTPSVLTTEEFLCNVGTFTVNTAQAEWLAKSYVKLGGSVQGGTLKITGQKPNSTIDVDLNPGAIGNLIISKGSITHHGNPTTVNSLFRAIDSVLTKGDNTTDAFSLSAGATWEIINTTHAADFTVSVANGLCLDEQVGSETKSCVGDSAKVPSSVTTAKFNCVNPASPPAGSPKGSEIAGIVIGVLIAIGLAAGGAFYFFKRRARHGYKDVDDSRL